ncbi:MAG: hypothetical protein AAFV53_26290 [Myxococcota bacterium]
MSPWWLVDQTELPQPYSMSQLPGPSPYSFLDALIRQIQGVDTLARRRLDTTRTHVAQVNTGHVGMEGCGYTWEETYSLDSSMFPARRAVSLDVTDRITLHWTWRAEKIGQAGYAGFRPGTLRVRFDDPSLQAPFTTLWERVMGIPLVLQTDD